MQEDENVSKININSITLREFWELKIKNQLSKLIAHTI